MQASANSMQSQAIIPWQSSVYNLLEYKKLERTHFKGQFYLMEAPLTNSLVEFCSKCLGQSQFTNLHLDGIPTEIRGPVRFYRWLNVNQGVLESLLQEQLNVFVRDMIRKISSFIELHPVEDFTLNYDWNYFDRSNRFAHILGASLSNEINEKLYFQVVKITAQFLISKSWLHSIQGTEITDFSLTRKIIKIEMNDCGELVYHCPSQTGHYINADHQFYRIIGLQDGWEKRNHDNLWTFSEEVTTQMQLEQVKLLKEIKIYHQNNPSCWKDFYNIIIIEEGPCQLKDYDPKTTKVIQPGPRIIEEVD